MKVAIVGSRDLHDECYETICSNVPVGCSTVISGGARGVDQLAERYAREAGIKLEVIYPQYELFDRTAPLVRNGEIVKKADYVLIVWDGKSRGSLNVIMTCVRENPSRY